MKRFQSLHAKILFGFGIPGLLFVGLALSALLHFRGLEDQIADQQRVTAVHDSIRYARRMEKNFLLYRKKADLAEAIDRADRAAALFAELPPIPLAGRAQPQEGELLRQYRQLLAELDAANRRARPSPETVEALADVGSDLLSVGEQLDALARQRLDDAIAAHHRDLLRAIAVAIVLALVSGAAVARSVARPLRRVEERLERIAAGEGGRIDLISEDREVASLTDAINRALGELEKREKAVARSSRLVALGGMLSGVAHELNNPLSNISTSCQILLEEIEETDPDAARRLLNQIDEQALRAQRIVGDLLDFARDRRFARRPEPLRTLIGDTLPLLYNQLGRQPRIDVDVDAALIVEVDRQRFQQVLLNLLKNAAEAIAPGGRIRLGARVSAAEADARPGTLITIEDDGQGIATEDLPRVFDPFFSTKPVGKGVGLGLFVVHEIVARHGGTISVDSTQGRGCRFSIFIPDTASANANDALPLTPSERRLPETSSGQS
ncbi:HAMP domain-containing histidine kinase [Rhodocyclus tenuis]|uniref:histidine kinase n=1 Tax=Rhodocyclus gracilis TaxID=2929842 RepID=A0ABX0WG14_9RHOO|nr:HAMP domain-containing sensor histidine kinase [Rhodocyclus gracilis]NJA88479.1 HAMP domain-containing histidine kinase [Rhodocyclus gracilis]